MSARRQSPAPRSPDPPAQRRRPAHSRRGRAAHRQGLAQTLGNLGSAAHYQGDYARASAFYEESVALLRALGAKRSLATGLIDWTLLALDQGNPPRAAALCAEGLTLLQDGGEPFQVAAALEAMAMVAATLRQPEHAVQLVGAGATLRAAIGTPLPPMNRPVSRRSSRCSARLWVNRPSREHGRRGRR